MSSQEQDGPSSQDRKSRFAGNSPKAWKGLHNHPCFLPFKAVTRPGMRLQTARKMGLRATKGSFKPGATRWECHPRLRGKLGPVPVARQQQANVPWIRKQGMPEPGSLRSGGVGGGELPGVSCSPPMRAQMGTGSQCRPYWLLLLPAHTSSPAR